MDNFNNEKDLFDNETNNEIEKEVIPQENNELIEDIQVEDTQTEETVIDEEKAEDTLINSDTQFEAFDNKNKKENKSGAKVFVAILCIALSIIIAVAGGYIAGMSMNKTSVGGGAVDIVNKPTDVEVYDTQKLYENAVESVVSIVVYNTKTGATSTASGVIMSSDGYIITNDHIYSDIVNPALLVTLSDGTEHKASFVAGDTRTDISVIKIDTTGLKAATFGDSEQLYVGEKVAAIGYSAGPKEAAVFTSGYISSKGTRTTNSSTYSVKMIQTDTVINPGSSGGALYNMYGQVIGITSSKLTGSSYEGINYAVPTNTAVKIANSLIANKYVTDRGRLGISYTEVDFVQSQLNNCPTGLQIQSISDDSSLKDKGLSVGDIITHINGEKITSSAVALDVFEETKPDVRITLSVYIASTKQTITVYATLIEDRGSSSYTEQASQSQNNFNQFLPDDDSGTIIK